MMLNPVDLTIIGIYLLIVAVVGVIAGRKQTFESYWVNRRQTSFLLLLFGLISTQVGAGAVVGLCSSAYESGIGYPLVALVSTTGGFLLVGFLAPRIKRFGDKYQAITIAEFLGTRYARNTELLGAGVILLGYLSFLAAQFLALARLLHVLTGVAILPALIMTAVALVFYTAYAGIRGDLLTDFIHFIVMFVALPVMAKPVLSLFSVASLGSAYEIPTTHWSPLTFGGPVFLIGGIFFGLILGLSSMEIWQRIYAAKGGLQAKRVFLMGAAGVVPFYAVFTFLGFVARRTFGPSVEPDSALFSILGNVMPDGLRGLTMAALGAAFMSTANSMILVLSATVTRNYLQLGKGAPVSTGERSDLVASRWISLGIGILGLLIALAIPHIVQLTLNAFYLIGLLAPPLVGGMVWARSGRWAANSSIVAGLLATAIAMPFAPRQAFLAAAVIAIPVFILVSLATKRPVSPPNVN